MTTLPPARPHVDEASMLRTLNRFAVDLIAIPSVEDLLWYVAQNVVGRLGFVDCVIYQANEAGTELTQAAAWGGKNPFGRKIVNPLVIPFGRGITGRVAETRKPIIEGDLLKNLNYIPDTQMARSEICVPLVIKGRLAGVIDSEHPDPNAFGEAELEILGTVASMTAAKLELLAEAERSAQRYQELVASHAQLTLEITARKALETRLFEARKLEAIGRLSGRFAHEFNNLLTVILGNLELLEVNPESPGSPEFLDAARSAAQRGARLIRDMLVFAQRTRLDPVDLDLNRFVTQFQGAEALVSPDPLELSLAADCWPVRIDREAMKAVLLNLVENARDAMPPDRPTQISTENLRHGPDAKEALADSELPYGRYVLLSVTDTGTGISPRHLSQIFDPFYTTKPVGAGTGLGLSIVRGFVQQSGGEVRVLSEEGRGTTVQVLLPAAPQLSTD
ncbi:ATP-binding protein [Sagittula sp. S175]|uniref:ATP-binding protein n=1 Tax=Sagittula sp. S175 TaxID=3415129 RepID=UPI003C7B7F42